MRKNKMLRLASGMMVATLLSTSVISGTFAKYVSTAKASDTARVAKWGVTVSASGTLFGSKYDTLNNKVGNTPTVEASGFSVEGKNSSAAADVVAPGTKSADTGFTFGITGTPEVKSKVSAVIEAKDIYLAKGTYGVMEKVTVDETNYATKVADGLYTLSGKSYTKLTGEDYNSKTHYYVLAYTAEVKENGYYPVMYSWYANGSNDPKNNTTKATAIAGDIAAKFNVSGTTFIDSDNTTAGAKYTVNKTFNPNTDLADITNGIGIGNEKLTWSWTFETSKDKTSVGDPVLADSDDARDTVLGELMAAGTGNTKVVAVTKDAQQSTITGVTVLTVDKDKIVKNEGQEVGCLETKFDIKLTVEQVD